MNVAQTIDTATFQKMREGEEARQNKAVPPLPVPVARTAAGTPQKMDMSKQYTDGKITTRSNLDFAPCLTPTTPKPNTWKSDMFLVPSKLDELTGGEKIIASKTKSSCGRFNKKFDYDNMLIKYRSNTGTGDRRSLTDIKVDKIEAFVLQSMSQDFQLNSGSSDSLDSHFKFFQSTVQQIFDNFYMSMHDFESYKARFEEILAKNKTQSVMEMEQFIKDIIHDIMSNETTPDQDNGSIQTGLTSLNVPLEDKLQSENVSSMDTITSSDSSNENYNLMNPNMECKKTESRAIRNGEIFNFYIMNLNPSENFKMTDRNMASEVNIRSAGTSKLSKVASAENIKKLAAKQKEIEIYAKQSDDIQSSDRNIPVKISSARNNILLEHDVNSEEGDKSQKSFISKVCHYLCKKLRRS